MNGVLKLIAALTMLIDHAGSVLFPQLTVLRIIGRISFPVFACGIARGYRHTSDARKYMFRMVLFGLVSQIPYSLLFGSTLNILFTFAVSILILQLKDKYGRRAYTAVLPFLLADIDYNVYGIITVILFHEFEERKGISAIAFGASTIVFSLLTGSHLQVFSIASLALIYWMRDKRLKINKYVYYGFYPAHLAALAVIRAVM